MPLQSYANMRAPGAFSEELLERILTGVSTQKYADTVLDAARAFGVPPSSVSRRLVELTATKLTAFHTRSLADFKPFAVFLDTIHRGGEAFLVALGMDVSGQKMALGACKINCVTGYHASSIEDGGFDDQARHENGCVVG